jgi:hypothetical protein
MLKDKFKVDGLVYGIINYQVYLNRNAITEKKINKDLLNTTVINYLLQDSAVDRAFVIDDVNNTTLTTKIKEAVTNGYYPSRSGDIQIIFHPAVDRWIFKRRHYTWSVESL